MKYIELLKVNRSFLHLLKKNGVVLQDVEMIEIYEKYLQMMQTEDKRVYIMEKLADEAGITSRTLYHIIKRMETEVEI